MKKFIFVLMIFIFGCATKNVQPQKFFDGDISMDNTSVLINQYSTGNLITLIAKVDEKQVGGAAYGSTGISELYIRPGKHKLNIISTVGGVHNYAGDITCIMAPGRFYTIDFSSNGESIGVLTMDLIFGTNKGNAGSELKVSCIEHAIKPENKNLAGKIFKNEMIPPPQ